MAELAVPLSQGQGHRDDQSLRDPERRTEVDIWPLLGLSHDEDVLNAASDRRHHDDKDRRDQPPDMLFQLLAADDGHDHGQAEQHHHENLDHRDAVEELRLEGPEADWIVGGHLHVDQVPMHHAQSAESDATGDKETDHAEGSMLGHAAMSGQPGLEDQKAVPERGAPVVDVHSPGVVVEISPVVHTDAQLHQYHGDQHPKV